MLDPAPGHLLDEERIRATIVVPDKHNREVPAGVNAYLEKIQKLTVFFAHKPLLNPLPTRTDGWRPGNIRALEHKLQTLIFVKNSSNLSQTP